MVEVLRMLLGALVVASLAIIVAYVAMFFAVVAWTVLRTGRRDLLADELDEVLADILGPQAPGTSRRPGDTWPSARGAPMRAALSWRALASRRFS